MSELLGMNEQPLPAELIIKMMTGSKKNKEREEKILRNNESETTQNL